MVRTTTSRFEGTLRLADPPDQAPDDQVGLVVTSDQIAILKSAVFDCLLSYIRALFNDVPAYVAALGKHMPGFRWLTSHLTSKRDRGLAARNKRETPGN
jgi:hypothetical protein